MIPIHVRYGEVLAWLKGTQIISLTGEHLAFLSNANDYAYSGKCLGSLRHGFLHD